MATEKGRTIADYAISKLGCAYIYGGYGEKQCTPAFRKERAAAYPSQKGNTYSNCLVLSGKQKKCEGCKWHGMQAYDCAQLTRYSCKAAGQELPSGATNQWKQVAWAAKGTIDTLPDVPGVLLYQSNGKGGMRHTGICIGNGYAVEARAAKYGVVKTVNKERPWTHWAALPGVLDGAEVQEPEQDAVEEAAPKGSVVKTMKTLRKGDRGTQVKVLQWLLGQNGHDAGTVDGIFGTKTLAAVQAYQKAKGLTVDGIVGAKTWEQLLA